MKLDYPFLQLPVSFDAALIAREIEALGESAWRPHPQGFPGNSALPLVSVDGDPGSDAVRGPMRPTSQLLACPYLMQTMHGIGAVWGRSRLMRLSGQAEVLPHVDINYYWREHMRVHVPIVTQPTVRFDCGDASINMAPGECWIFDSWRQHRVLNDAGQSRIHLVIDTVGASDFWALVAQGQAHGAPHDPVWQPRRLAPQPGLAGFPLETMNLPEVMTPWEMQAHFDLLFGDALPHPQLARVQQLATELVLAWRGLWARFGTAPEGRAQFLALMAQFVAQVKIPAQTIALRNDTGWFSGMIAMIGRPAARPLPAAAPGRQIPSPLARPKAPNP